MFIVSKFTCLHTLYNLVVSFLLTADHDTDSCRINTMLHLDEGKKIIFFRAFRINFQVLLIVMAFDNIPIFIF